MAWPYTFTKINTFRRGVLIAFTVTDGATPKGEVEQFIERIYTGDGLRKKKYWRAKRPSGKVVATRTWNRDAAARRL